MSVLFARPNRVRPGGFEIERGTFEVVQSASNLVIGLVLGVAEIEANSRYAATEHWILFPSYVPPCVNMTGPDVTITIRPVKPSQILAAWSIYDANRDVPHQTFVDMVRNAHPGSTYLIANVQRIP